MREPLVSVKMLVYNHKPYIRRAIESVLAQKTDFPFELVIGEDCSTDGTREIVLEYQKKYPNIIRVITSDHNVGAKKNSYRTNQACRSKYIAYCEGDDFWHRSDKLQIQVDYLESHPDCGLVYSDHDRYFAKNRKTIKRFYYTTNNLPPKNLNVFRGWGLGLNILTCTVMVRKDLLDRISSDPYLYQSDHYIGGGDIVFSEISLVSKSHYINESLSTYTVQIESGSNTRNPSKRMRFSISVCEGYLYIAQKYGYCEEISYLEGRRTNACLWLAFLERNDELAKEMKSKSSPFSIKAWMLYYGAVNLLLHFVMYIFVITYWTILTVITDCRLFYGCKVRYRQV